MYDKPVKYEVRDDKRDEKDATAKIMIKEGRFVGFSFSFGIVKMHEPTENDKLKIDFTYKVHEVPEDYDMQDLLNPNEGFKDKFEEQEQKEFEKTMSDILYDIIANQKIETLKNGNNDT